MFVVNVNGCDISKDGAEVTVSFPDGKKYSYGNMAKAIEDCAVWQPDEEQPENESDE